MATRKSWNIDIKQFRQILIWPLTLSLNSSDDTAETIKSSIEAINKALNDHDDWEQVEDLLDHISPPNGDEVAAKAEQAHAYAEFVYFYDFLQTMLYRGPVESGRVNHFRVWRNISIKGVEFEVLQTATGREREVTYQADIERLNLYVFATGAVVMVAELNYASLSAVDVNRSAFAEDALNMGEKTCGLTLEDALTINDLLRRVYTPFFEINSDGTDVAKQVPSRVRWFQRDVADAPDFRPDSLDKAYAFVKAKDQNRGRTAPVAEHWRMLLRPLIFAGYEGDVDSLSRDMPVWRQVLDERIPLMSFVSVTGGSKGDQKADFGLINRGDWVRLCYADRAGSDEMPYSPRFLENFEAEACYDRFFPDKGTSGASRFMFAGFHFVMVGAGRFFDKTSIDHFRRHYFQMGLLANMELASLLATSSRITKAVDRLAEGKAIDRVAARRKFRTDLISIEEDFLDFVHRFSFTGVSNQIQPAEIYGRWRKSMKLNLLFKEVKEELEAAIQFNGSVEQSEIGQSGQQLSKIAALVSVVGIALGLSSLGLIVDPLKGIITGLYQAMDQTLIHHEPMIHESYLYDLLFGLSITSIFLSAICGLGVPACNYFKNIGDDVKNLLGKLAIWSGGIAIVFLSTALFLK